MTYRIGEVGFYATYYNEREKSEVEILLNLWSKYEKRASPHRTYGKETIVDKPMPCGNGRTLCLMIQITGPGDREEQDEILKENMLEDTL